MRLGKAGPRSYGRWDGKGNLASWLADEMVALDGWRLRISDEDMVRKTLLKNGMTNAKIELLVIPPGTTTRVVRLA